MVPAAPRRDDAATRASPCLDPPVPRKAALAHRDGTTSLPNAGPVTRPRSPFSLAAQSCRALGDPPAHHAGTDRLRRGSGENRLRSLTGAGRSSRPARFRELSKFTTLGRRKKAEKGKGPVTVVGNYPSWQMKISKKPKIGRKNTCSAPFHSPSTHSSKERPKSRLFFNCLSS